MTMLTPRQSEVLVLIRKGIPYAEIAERLGISVGTVNQHAADILTKLQKRNRAELQAMQEPKS